MKNRDLRELKVAAAQNVRERDYWKSRFPGAPVKSSFPYDHIKTGLQTASAGLKEYYFKWEEPLYSRLMELCKYNDHALHVVLAAALAALLGRYTGMEDIILATPIYRQEGEGQYINTVLPLQISLESGVTFKLLLGRVKQTLLKAVEHQAYPVELLPELLNIPGQGTGFPLFDTALELENIHPNEYLEHINLSMIFRFLRTAGAIMGTIVYDFLLYEQSTIERIEGHLTRFVQSALVNPEMEIFTMEILSGAEKKQLLEDFNDTQAEYPKDKTIHQLFEEQASKTPDRIALVGAAPRVCPVNLTYRQLNEQSGRLAGLLIEKGVAAENIVGLKIGRSVEMIVGILGILKPGAAYLPIDPGYPQERIDYMLKDSNAKMMIGRTEFMFSCFFPISSFPRFPAFDSSNLAYIIYTSGSTGRPKGVMVEHRSLVNLCTWHNTFYSITLRDRAAKYAGFGFDASVWEIFPYLVTGASLYIATEEIILDIDALNRYFEKNSITIGFLPTQMCEQFSALNNGSLRVLLTGGDKLRKYIKRNYRLYNNYGPTENTVVAASFCVMEESANIPIGKPVFNNRIYIMDRYLRLQPIGAPGELYVGGDNLARGYLNNPGLTAEKFDQDLWDYKDEPDEKNKSFSGGPGGRFYKKAPLVYRTGDLARWLPDGNIEFLGRIDQQVKIRGFRIELGEIENRLLAHKEIKDAVVIVKEGESGDKYLCAYVAPHSAGDASLTGRLIDYLAAALPAFMIPSYIVSLDSIPLTPNGKIDRKALPGPGTGSAAGDVYNPPADETEHRLAAIWSEMLNIERETIGRDTNFFKIGGHSLKAAALIRRIHKEFNTVVSMMEVFDFPRLKDLTVCIKKAGVAAYFRIHPAEKKKYYPLSSAQERLYVIQQGMPSDTTYNIATVVTLEGKLDRRRMENTFRCLIERHESLRTSFRVVGNEAVQLVHDGVKFDMEYYDLVVNGKREEKQIIMNLIRPFDLSRAPLLRVGLIKTTGERYILAADTHHIISDARSQEVLLEEFMHLYRGETLPELRLQYKDFSQWQNNLVISGQIKKQEAYWLNRFKGPLPVLELPTDYQRPRVRSFEGSHTGFEIGAAEVEKLRRLAVRENASLFMVILAIYNVLLFKLSGQEDIIVGTATAGRSHADLERIIGVFINTLALRSYPAGYKSFNQFLKEVRQGTLEAFDNQDYQFEDLVDHVLKERDPVRNPLFDVMFNFAPQDRETNVSSAAELEFKPYGSGFEYKESRVDLLISGVDRGDRFFFVVEYSTRLFKKETILRFSQYFKEIIAAAAENENTMLRDIPLSIDLVSAKNRLFQDDDNDFGF